MASGETQQPAVDARTRPLRDLRISVTDRCNFRCRYCMPREVFGASYEFLPHNDLLTFEEIARTTTTFAQLGVHKVRLTGGEPLLRRDLAHLISLLANVAGIDDIALTTNGSLLTRDSALQLRAAGLKRITISLDSLEDDVFMAMNDVRFPVARVLAAIDAAVVGGLNPVKVNMVVKRQCNDDGVVAMAERFRHTGVQVRFIEYMDVGNSNGWKLDDVVPAAEILARIDERWPLEPMTANQPGDVAVRYRYQDGAGEVGIIASVTQPFCAGCTRARLSSEGKIFTCLFGTTGHDIRALLRSGATNEELLAFVRQLWSVRSDRYSELRTSMTATPHDKVEMSHIGG